ncbi:MAG: lipid-A-disaccharide synthase N-terminal domain-containing protein [Mangrovibacterium sp.]
MAHQSVYIIGFLAQSLFSARLIAQWLLSEKAGRVLSPLIFWQLSILASWLLFIYGLLRNDFAIILGQVISYPIYIRNLQLQHNWIKLPLFSRFIAISVPVLVFIVMIGNWNYHYHQLFENKDIPVFLLIWGVTGQLIFAFRFVYQWIYSEHQGESCLPRNFWLISIGGSLMIFTYAVYRLDPVLMIGQCFGFFVYVRNLILIQKQKYNAYVK